MATNYDGEDEITVGPDDEGHVEIRVWKARPMRRGVDPEYDQTADLINNISGGTVTYPEEERAGQDPLPGEDVK